MGILALQVLMAASLAHAQGDARPRANGYPSKSVRVIVPLAPGGGSDIVARIISSVLVDHWGQPVVVDNRPGAGSTVGTAIAAKAAADGYTLLVTSSSIAISPALYKNLGFDVKRDLAGVTLIGRQPSILAVHASVPAATVKELIALARAQPGKLAYASAGSGSATHLGAELFKYSTGVDLIHVPYKSAGLATSALLSGEAQVVLTNMASVLPHLKSGRIKALGISASKRSALAPTLPTVAESGVEGFEYSTWYAMLAPAGTPKAIIQRIWSDLALLIRHSRTHDRFVALGMETYVTTPAELDAYLYSEIAKWDKVIRAAGVRAE